MDDAVHGMILATEVDVDNKYMVRDNETGEAYNYLVRDIVADKKSGGAHNLYREDGGNSYDPILGRLFREKKKWDELAAKNRVAMDKVIGLIEGAQKGGKVVRSGDVVRWQEESMKLQEEFVEFRGNSEKLVPSIGDCEYNRMIEEMMRRNIRVLRDKFFEDGDVEYLEKGVVWATKYAEKHRTVIDFAAFSSGE